MADHDPTEGSVLAPEWEEALRRGQAEEGQAGSVEAELAVLHLLRHARQAEEISQARLDTVWGQVAGASAGLAPWWRRRWIVWAPAAAAAVAVLVVIAVPRDDAPELARGSAPAEATSAPAPAPAAPAGEAVPPADGTGAAAVRGNAALLEQQFSVLEPRARQAIGVSIESGRGSLRYGLLDTAKGGGR
jgi:hypothetical protein